jgi:hypothetical protein
MRGGKGGADRGARTRYRIPQGNKAGEATPTSQSLRIPRLSRNVKRNRDFRPSRALSVRRRGGTRGPARSSASDIPHATKRLGDRRARVSPRPRGPEGPVCSLPGGPSRRIHCNHGRYASSKNRAARHSRLSESPCAVCGSVLPCPVEGKVVPGICPRDGRPR